MRVLVGGEHNGHIRDAFAARGHYSMSCDFRDTVVSGKHHKGNWRDVWGDGWDLMIFHFTCTFMANSGAKWLYRDGNRKNGLDEERWLELGRHAWNVWNDLDDCPVEKVAVENPVMLDYAQKMAGLSDRSKWQFQTVQPWWFGTDPNGPDNVKKATCWWTRGLPKLRPTGILDGSTARAEVHMMTPTEDPEDRRMARSEFTPGHAEAIAGQWGRDTCCFPPQHA